MRLWNAYEGKFIRPKNSTWLSRTTKGHATNSKIYYLTLWWSIVRFSHYFIIVVQVTHLLSVEVLHYVDCVNPCLERTRLCRLCEKEVGISEHTLSTWARWTHASNLEQSFLVFTDLPDLWPGWWNFQTQSFWGHLSALDYIITLVVKYVFDVVIPMFRLREASPSWCANFLFFASFKISFVFKMKLWKHHQNKSFQCVYQQFWIHSVSPLTRLLRVHLSAVLSHFADNKSKFSFSVVYWMNYVGNFEILT
jgi:hypothetical protein